LASTKRRSRKAKAALKPKVPLPDHLRVLALQGVEYFMQWEKLVVGSSFFVPTTATPMQVRVALLPVSRFFRIRFEVRSRCEYGRYGARVWRVY
jgi:hypothetical protein